MHCFFAATEGRGQLVNVSSVANDEVGWVRDRDDASVASDDFDDTDHAALYDVVDDAADDDESKTPDCDGWTSEQLDALELCGDDVSTQVGGEDTDDGDEACGFGDGLSRAAVDWDSGGGADSRGMVDEVGDTRSDACWDALWEAQATSALSDGDGDIERDDWMSGTYDVADEYEDYDESEARSSDDAEGPLDADRGDLKEPVPTDWDATEDDAFGPQDTSTGLWEIEQDAAALEVPGADRSE